MNGRLDISQSRLVDALPSRLGFFSEVFFKMDVLKAPGRTLVYNIQKLEHCQTPAQGML